MSQSLPEPHELIVPVERLASDPPVLQAEEQGIALCLSGGGYRAMLFHVGAIIRLNELGYLGSSTGSPAFQGATLPPACSV